MAAADEGSAEPGALSRASPPRASSSEAGLAAQKAREIMLHLERFRPGAEQIANALRDFPPDEEAASRIVAQLEDLNYSAVFGSAEAGMEVLAAVAENMKLGKAEHQSLLVAMDELAGSVIQKLGAKIPCMDIRRLALDKEKQPLTHAYRELAFSDASVRKFIRTGAAGYAGLWVGVEKKVLACARESLAAEPRSGILTRAELQRYERALFMLAWFLDNFARKHGRKAIVGTTYLSDAHGFYLLEVGLSGGFGMGISAPRLLAAYRRLHP